MYNRLFLSEFRLELYAVWVASFQHHERSTLYAGDSYGCFSPSLGMWYLVCHVSRLQTVVAVSLPWQAAVVCVGLSEDETWPNVRLLRDSGECNSFRYEMSHLWDQHTLLRLNGGHSEKRWERGGGGGWDEGSRELGSSVSSEQGEGWSQAFFWKMCWEHTFKLQLAAPNKFLTT